jgi:putative peptidoglycan lipid II flippase
VVTAIVALALYSPFGVGGIVVGTVVATIASVCAQAVVLRRLLGGIELGRFLESAVRVTISAAVMAGVSYLVWYGLDQALGRSTIAQILSLGVALAAGFATYFAAVLALRVPEAAQIMRLVRRI